MTFYELAGEGARVQLEALAKILHKAEVETELLESQTQAGVFLLVCRTNDLLVTAPENAKVWQFRQVE